MRIHICCSPQQGNATRAEFGVPGTNRLHAIAKETDGIVVFGSKGVPAYLEAARICKIDEQCSLTEARRSAHHLDLFVESLPHRSEEPVTAHSKVPTPRYQDLRDEWNLRSRNHTILGLES